jgi:hypothetical protein
VGQEASQRERSILVDEHEDIRGFPDSSERVSLLLIVTKKNPTNQRVVTNRHLPAARERYVTIEVKTSPADNHVPYLKSFTFEVRYDGPVGGCNLALLSEP